MGKKKTPRGNAIHDALSPDDFDEEGKAGKNPHRPNESNEVTAPSLSSSSSSSSSSSLLVKKFKFLRGNTMKEKKEKKKEEGEEVEGSMKKPLLSNEELVMKSMGSGSLKITVFKLKEDTEEEEKKKASKKKKKGEEKSVTVELSDSLNDAELLLSAIEDEMGEAVGSLHICSLKDDALLSVIEMHSTDSPLDIIKRVVEAEGVEEIERELRFYASPASFDNDLEMKWKKRAEGVEGSDSDSDDSELGIEDEEEENEEESSSSGEEGKTGRGKRKVKLTYRQIMRRRGSALWKALGDLPSLNGAWLGMNEWPAFLAPLEGKVVGWKERDVAYTAQYLSKLSARQSRLILSKKKSNKNESEAADSTTISLALRTLIWLIWAARHFIASKSAWLAVKHLIENPGDAGPLSRLVSIPLGELLRRRAAFTAPAASSCCNASPSLTALYIQMIFRVTITRSNGYGDQNDNGSCLALISTTTNAQFLDLDDKGRLFVSDRLMAPSLILKFPKNESDETRTATLIECSWSGSSTAADAEKSVQRLLLRARSFFFPFLAAKRETASERRSRTLMTLQEQLSMQRVACAFFKNASKKYQVNSTTQSSNIGLLRI